MSYVLPTLRAMFLALLLLGVVADWAGPLQPGGVWIVRSARIIPDPHPAAQRDQARDCARRAIGRNPPVVRSMSKPVRVIRGRASWVAEKFGSGYLAARLPKGTRLRICGPRGCVVAVVNDRGPDRRVFPGRVVDLSRARFARVCGDPGMGTCPVVVSIIR